MTYPKDLDYALEQLRFIIFKGTSPTEKENLPLHSQEEYVFEYEQQLERDPGKERKLIEKYSVPILPLYRQQMEQVAKMDQLISGNTDPISFSNEDVLDELYDDIANLETEAEWQDFKKRILEI